VNFVCESKLPLGKWMDLDLEKLEQRSCVPELSPKFTVRNTPTLLYEEEQKNAFFFASRFSSSMILLIKLILGLMLDEPLQNNPNIPIKS
jgi:hypothetical protein